MNARRMLIPALLAGATIFSGCASTHQQGTSSLATPPVESHQTYTASIQKQIQMLLRQTSVQQRQIEELNKKLEGVRFIVTPFSIQVLPEDGFYID